VPDSAAPRPAGPPDPDDAVDPALLRLAARVQAAYQEHGQTLNDPDTAQAYRAALDFVRGIHDGALATGVVDAEQHQVLAGMIESARLAPDVL